MMQVSIVIPAYNESETLPRTLASIQRQRGVEYEIIVADAFSEDDTREIAVSHGARVVDGGSPAAGRNAGAAVATGEVILFLDADVVIKRGFLKNTWAEFTERQLVAATCRIKPLSRLTMDRILHDFANLYVRLVQFSDPNAPGYCILIRTDVFRKIGGFDESLKLAEDHNLVKRAAKYGAFRLLRSAFIYVDVRRLDKEGRLAYAMKTIKVSVYRALQGEIAEESDVVEYEFGDFTEDEVSGSRKALRDLEKALLKLDRKTTDLDERVVAGLDSDMTIRERIERLKNQLSEGWEAITGDSSRK
jgi:glycosyltransferase involved in cell wall biosynthesis